MRNMSKEALENEEMIREMDQGMGEEGMEVEGTMAQDEFEGMGQ